MLHDTLDRPIFPLTITMRSAALRPQALASSGGAVLVREVNCLCGVPLMDAPKAWGAVSVSEIAGRQRASGHGIVRRCVSQNCKRWVDVTFAEHRTAA